MLYLWCVFFHTVKIYRFLSRIYPLFFWRVIFFYCKFAEII